MLFTDAFIPNYFVYLAQFKICLCYMMFDAKKYMKFNMARIVKTHLKNRMRTLALLDSKIYYKLTVIMTELIWPR